jgi:hypothetical protein
MRAGGEAVPRHVQPEAWWKRFTIMWQTRPSQPHFQVWQRKSEFCASCAFPARRLRGADVLPSLREANISRHCEERSDEAIHNRHSPLDCFATLAMTRKFASVIARSEATKQSRLRRPLDCFAALAMTSKFVLATRSAPEAYFKRHERPPVRGRRSADRRKCLGAASADAAARLALTGRARLSALHRGAWRGD